MPPDFTSYKQSIDECLSRFLNSQKDELFRINSLGGKSIDILDTFTRRGKTIRGSLVLWISELYGKSSHPGAVYIAAAIELMHSGLLIHDDIMDRDATRRGNPSLYSQFNTLRDLSDDNEYGINIAICAGDLSFFLAQHCLLSLHDSSLSETVQGVLSAEIAAVTIAQMQDVSFGMFSTIPSTEEVLDMYKYKTGKYSLSLPMRLGSILVGNSDEETELLDKLGEEIGILFQIRDDELNLYGDQKISGKPVGSDIREAKKTIYISTLFAKADSVDREKMITLFDKVKKSQEAQNQIYELLKKYSIREVLSEDSDRRVSQIKRTISQLHITDIQKQACNDFVTFILKRNH